MELVEFIYASDNARSTSELQAIFARFIANFDLEYFLVAQVSLRAFSGNGCGVRMTNFPEAWIERYKAVGYADCVSVYNECRRANRPLTFVELVLSKLPSGSVRLIKEASLFGIESGAILSLCGSNGGHFICVFAGRAKDARLDGLSLALLRLASFQLLMSFVSEDREARDSGARLTERELEVLCLIAEGKSKRKVAELLSVSEASVKRHCESVFEKLGANSLASAVSKAMSLGLIDPNPAEATNEAR
jgi:DNA-binding CsgD family transcriptional regulator